MRRQRLPSCTVNGLTPPEIRPHKRKKPTGIPIGNDFIMVELVGVEPMTYTMRTYRSSQLSYSPMCWTGFPATFLKIAFLWRKSSRILKKIR